MEHDYHIEYENVSLRPLRIDDIEKLRIWRNDPSNAEFLSKIPYITSDMQLEWFYRYLDNSDELCFSIVEKKDLNRIVGSLSLYSFDNNLCYFGKILIGDPEAHGKKIGFNATTAALKIAFEQLEIKKVKLHVYADNSRALYIYKKAGFHIIHECYSGEDRLEYTMIKNMEI